MSIDSYRTTQSQTASAALTEAAAVGDHAPSVQDTRPWRWRVDGDILELSAEPTRQLPDSDPGARLLVLSCGAALHHARVALAALGWGVEIDRMPDSGEPRLLVRLRLSGRLTVTREAIRRLRTVRIRSTYRPPATGAPVAAADLDAIRAAVEDEHAWLRILRSDDVLDLGTSLDRLAVDAVLFGTDDTPTAWLHAGEALSAAWLTATERGLSVLPLNAPVDVETTRLTLRRLLPQDGQPFLILRFAHAHPSA